MEKFIPGFLNVKVHYCVLWSTLSWDSRESIREAAAAFKPSNIFKRPLQTCACKRNSLEELSKIEPLIGWTIPACNNDRAAQIEDSRTYEVKGVRDIGEGKTERN